MVAITKKWVTPISSPRYFGKEVVIETITDNAGGMSEHVQTRIFESQFMAKSIKRGTSLGLSIAHQIVTDTHQGDITCQPVLGKGSIFGIALPV